MNKWEEAYAAELANQQRVHLIDWWEREPYRLRLADDAWYKPDFSTRTLDKITMIEIKGMWREAAMVRFKTAARLFPHHRFLAIRKKKVSEGGGWEIVKELNS
jgi:predicted nuclease of restriction endonuclease-like RecB superfamily